MTSPAEVTVPPLVTITGVDILAAGQWNLSTGTTTFTPEDLAAGVEAAQCPSIGKPILKIGHEDQRFTPGDGEPAIGRVDNMELAASGNKITGDLAGMPGWLGSVLPSAYPQRSIEGYWDVHCQQGHHHPFVIASLALLGVVPPGVGVLSSLEDVAALFGVAASARPWRTQPRAAGGEPMPGIALAAGVTTEDVRRAYYEMASYSMWITEMQLNPPQLIVADDNDSKVYRVPVKIKGSDVTFGDPVEVSVEYMDVAAARAGQLIAWATAATSRQGMVIAKWDGAAQVKNMGDSPTQAQLNKMFALPASTKSDSKLPHHMCPSGGSVGEANTDGCSAGIAAINGGRGGLKDVSDADKTKAYNHLAKHLTDAGLEAPEMAAAGGDPDAEAGAHGSFTGDHSHAHSAYGAQGGDATHEHMHTHAGDGVHNHAHAAAAAAEGADMLSDAIKAAIRVRLGKKDDEELTDEEINEALAAALTPPAPAPEKPPAGVTAPADGSGMHLVDDQQLATLQASAARGEEAWKKWEVKERDDILTAAVKAGKFPLARMEHYQRLWDADPVGAKAQINAMAAGLIPVGPKGMPGFGADGTSFEDQQTMALLYPDDPSVKAAQGG